MTKTLIFGGTDGMGRAIADALIAQGSQVHVTSRSSEKIAASGLPGSVCDVLGIDQIKAAVAEAGEGLSGLVFAVGSIVLKPLKALKADDFLQAFALNTLAAAQAVQAAAPTLKANQGSVLLFSTVAVAQGFPNHAAISAAKGGVEGLTRALAAELAPHIRVNCLAPSLTDTAMAKSMTCNEAMVNALAKLHPLGRLGEAKDFGELGAFLVSPQSSWMTGQIIGVDGGRSALAGK